MTWGWRIALALGGVLAVIGFAIGAYIKGRNEGYDMAVAERAAADAKAEIERKGDDAKLQTLNQHDLCVAGLRANRMPVDACEQLRGL